MHASVTLVIMWRSRLFLCHCVGQVWV
jgi:hypothetical protein